MAAVNSTSRTPAANRVIHRALRILQEELRAYGPGLNSPGAVKEFLRIKIGQLEHEIFVVIWLNAQNQVIEYVELFRGTLTQTAVYPRELVKGALAHNAAAAIFAHNHPSGVAEPSRSDEVLTAALKTALALVDVKVLDHFIVGSNDVVSFAEKGLL
jgi:DNA repair protein RadC